MSPDFIFNIGVAVCSVCCASAVIAAVILRFYKKRLDSRLDAEYGKRRRAKK